MRTVALEGMYFYAYHGYYKEERQIGNQFRVDLWVRGPYNAQADLSQLDETIDYGKIYRLVRKEMQQPAYLLEEVGQRIIDSFKNQFSELIDEQHIRVLMVQLS
jgi:dihydroneopterin aldolase